MSSLNTRVVLTCEQCGDSYEVIRCRLGRSRFCSRKCSDDSKRAEPNVVCGVCGKSYHIKPWLLMRSKNHYCSVACRSEAMKQNMRGENNHQYGLTGELNASWRSDLRMTNYGYLTVRSPNHPFKNSGGFVFLHRLVFEEAIRELDPGSDYLVDVEGYSERFLSPDVVIHHKNGNRLDCRFDNLEPMSLGDHTAMHNVNDSYERDSLGRFVRVVTKIKRNPGMPNNLFKKHLLDAGRDIQSKEDKIVPANGRALISTGLYIAIPKGYVGLIWSRSGLSYKHGIQVGAGCIDATYRGEIKVLLYNFSDSVFEVKAGDRIAQLLIIQVSLEPLQEVDNLPETERGEGGFGSTGMLVETMQVPESLQ